MEITTEKLMAIVGKLSVELELLKEANMALNMKIAELQKEETTEE